jgi:hypothetical protein
MNMKSIITNGLLLLLSIAVAGAQETFHGTVTYKYEMKGESAEMMASFMPEALIVKYAEEGMITEMRGGMMADMMGTIIVNTKDDEVFVRKDSEKAVYLIKEEVNEEDRPDATEVTKLDEQETILGYDCRKYKMVIKQNGQEVTQFLWVTDKLKAPKVETPKMQRLGGSIVSSDKIPGFPMRMELSIPGMPVQMVMTATDLDFTKIDGKAFERPKDYAVKDVSELMKMGMGN